MAKRKLIRELTDEEILRVARLRVTESSNTTFTETSIDTQLSVERGVIWLINFIEFHIENPSRLNEVGAGGFERVSIQLTRETKTSFLNSNDSDILQQYEWSINRSSAIGTDAGPLWYMGQAPKRFNFPVPIPYASASIFLGIIGTHASSTHTVGCRVGYSIAEVSDKFFFRVAQALLG